MSAAARSTLSRESDSTKARSAKRLTVNKPGDSFEQEADRVADTVSSGGKIPAWSLSPAQPDHIQRDTSTAAALPQQPPIPQIGDPQDPPKVNNVSDIPGKLAEALLATPAGKKITSYLTDQPVVKKVEDFAETPTGILVGGSTALAAIAALAAAHKGLPIQIPTLPLDKIHPGLKLKIDVEGPLNHPTQGSLMLSFGSASPKKKKGGPTESEKYRAQTARIAEDAKFGAGVDPGQLGPVASQQTLDRQADDRRAQNYAVSRMSAILQPGATQAPGQFTPLVPGTQPISLGMRDAARIPPPTPTKSATNAPKDAAATEETPVQRKAEPAWEYDRSPSPEIETSVESVLNSSGNPLDPTTRRTMESRFGFDFSQVRIHTDSQAAASARSIRARAYTVGNHIVFSDGRYAPNTHEGRRLLAHELTHTVQQGASPQLAPGHAPIHTVLPAVVTPAKKQIQRDPDEDSKAISGTDWVVHPWESLKKSIVRIPGYKLMTTIIAYDPVADQAVVRNPTNLLGEFLKLVGAEKTFKDLQESHAIEDAFAWLQDELSHLDLSIQKVKDLIEEAVKTGFNNITSGVSAAIRSMYEVFKPTITAIKEFASHVLRKVGDFLFEGALRLVGGTGVLDILHQAGDALSTIIKDPVAFVGHLVDALKKGFNQFSDKIVDHLKAGVMEWLFGKLGKVEIPKKISVGSVFNLILSVLGLDYKSIRPRMVKALGSEEAVKFLEGAFDVLQTIVKDGFGAAWELILKKAGNLLDNVLAAVKDWAVTKVVTIAVAKLVTLFNPAGAVVEAIQAIYATLKVFIEKAQQIAALIKAITSSISKIAAGDIAAAADFIEGVMAKSIPLMIGFLADYLHLGDIADKVREIVEGLKEKIGIGIDKVFNYIVEKGKAFYEKGKAAAGKVLDWWRQRKEVLVGDEEHSIYLDGSEDSTHLMIASFPALTWTEFLDQKREKATKPQKKLIDDIKAKATILEARLSPSADEDEKAKNVEAKRKLFNEIADMIVALGLHHDAEAPASVIEYLPVRAGDDGGTGANASVLSPKHPPGTVPSDEPKIWKDLGTLIQKKNYVQGHLLNHNLGGEGRRFNLTPINKKANAEHLQKIERTVKTAVNTEKRVMSYKVDVVYGSHSNKPKRMLELEDLKSKQPLTPDQAKELSEFEAEQRLCTGFTFEAHELEHDGKTWVPKKESAAQFKGDVTNELAL